MIKPSLTPPENGIQSADLDVALFKNLPTVGEFSEEKVLTLLREELSAEQFHKDKRSFHALRAGALFHVLKMKSGRGFWKLCESNLGVGHSTVSRKMRLVAAWAKTSGASEQQVLELSQAADFDRDHPLGQMVLAFIGDDDVSELYRKHKITAPAAKGGFKFNSSELKTFVAEHHPEHAGKKYEELPDDVQKKFRKKIKREIDPSLLDKANAAFWDEIETKLAEGVEEKTFVTLPVERIRELRTLCYDAVQAFDKVLSKLGKK